MHRLIPSGAVAAALLLFFVMLTALLGGVDAVGGYMQQSEDEYLAEFDDLVRDSHSHPLPEALLRQCRHPLAASLRVETRGADYDAGDPAKAKKRISTMEYSTAWRATYKRFSSNAATTSGGGGGGHDQDEEHDELPDDEELFPASSLIVATARGDHDVDDSHSDDDSGRSFQVRASSLRTAGGGVGGGGVCQDPAGLCVVARNTTLVMDASLDVGALLVRGHVRWTDQTQAQGKQGRKEGRKAGRSVWDQGRKNPKPSHPIPSHPKP